eukprot:12233195-Alexandrium_andersonii.AAC.1
MKGSGSESQVRTIRTCPRPTLRHEPETSARQRCGSRARPLQLRSAPAQAPPPSHSRTVGTTPT